MELGILFPENGVTGLPVTAIQESSKQRKPLADGYYRRAVGRNLCGRSAAGQVGLRISCGDFEASLLGGSIGLTRGQACAPPLLKRIPRGGRRRFSGASKRDAGWRHGGHERGHGRTVFASR